MGATASRSSPTTHLVTISEYSKLVRVPVPEPRIFDTIFFNNLYWDVIAIPKRFNEDEEGLAESIYVSVIVSSESRYLPDLILKGIHISMEILDETGENTVFHKDSDRWTLQDCKCSYLGMSRRELEASSCLRNDSFTVRCTLSKQQQETKWCFFSDPKKLAVVAPQVAMAGSHMLTVGSFSKLKAALRGGECTYSTHFAVAGYRWYFQFCPTGEIGLVRASKDKTPTTAEFSFELEGVVNFESEKITHTFDHRADYSRYLYRFRLEPSTSAMDDHLIVRCCLAVMIVEKPSLPPTTIRTATTPRTESMLTPLLSAMYD